VVLLSTDFVSIEDIISVGMTFREWQ